MKNLKVYFSPSSYQICNECDGLREIEYDNGDDGTGYDAGFKKCKKCEGTGEIDAEPNITLNV